METEEVVEGVEEVVVAAVAVVEGVVAVDEIIDLTMMNFPKYKTLNINNR